MTKKDDGGPAFPRFVPGGHYNGSEDFPGMTLRDWFAGRAISGVCVPAPDGWSLTPMDHAQWAYQIADAMLEARK